MLDPLIHILPLRDEELKMVETGSELVEGILRSTGVLDQANFESRARIYETCVALPFVGRLVLTADRQTQQLAIPRNTFIQAGNGQSWDQTTRNRGHRLESAKRSGGLHVHTPAAPRCPRPAYGCVPTVANPRLSGNSSSTGHCLRTLVARRPDH